MKNATLEMNDGTKRRIQCGYSKPASYFLAKNEAANCVVLDTGFYLYRDQVNVESVKARYGIA